MIKKLKNVSSFKRIAQIEKIVTYAHNFLNVEIQFLDTKNLENCSGEYTAPKGQRKANISIDDSFSGLGTILTLLHELGHHIDYLKRGYVGIEEEAYLYYPDTKNEICPIKYRKHIRKVENEANKHAWEIATYLDLKIPIFSYIKDVVYQQESLNYTLAHGITDKIIRKKLWKKSDKIAKKILQSPNPLLHLFATR